MLHLGERSDALLPAAPRSRNDAKEWLFAALNSVEVASLHWSLLMFSGESRDTAAWKLFDEFIKVYRLGHLELVLARREWLAGTFFVADILMADVLRLVDRFDGLPTIPPVATRRPRYSQPFLREGIQVTNRTISSGGLRSTPLRSLTVAIHRLVRNPATFDGPLLGADGR